MEASEVGLLQSALDGTGTDALGIEAKVQ